MSEPLYYADRSGITADWLCGMKFWWGRKEGGVGISPLIEADALRVGREIHEDVAAIATMEDISIENINALINTITEPLNDAQKINQSLMETLYRRLGWLAAWAIYIEPTLRKEYENVGTEAEIILDRSPLWVAVTPDRLLRHRERHYLVYKEFKSTISSGPKWINHWPYAVQVHLGMKAIEEEMEEKVAFTQIVGLMKGNESYGRLNHPYVWAYRRGDDWRSDYAAGWDHAPVWEYPGGIVEWVTRLGEDVARSQFPHSAPIFLNERLLDQMIERRIEREREIAEWEDASRVDPGTRNLVFEQRTEQCRPAFGDPCPFLAACWNAEINKNPLGSGLYKIREPHHEIEVEWLKGLY
jgi:hypothetical protein